MIRTEFQAGSHTVHFDGDSRLKSIVVNGKTWGYIRQKTHGCHGHSYTFDQVNGGRIGEVDKSDRFYPFKVKSDKLLMRTSHGEEYDHDPLPLRLRKAVIELIETGRLRDPEILRQEHEALMAENRKQREEQTKIEKQAFRDRAREALRGTYATEAPFGLVDKLTDRIEEAMRWAQTR
jgi:hypothetical protein